MGMDNIESKSIDGYENYIAYKDGSIFSIKSNKFLKPIIHNSGYASVSLYKEGKAKQFSWHRIIAQTFLPNPNNLPEVDHIDCNPLNNSVSNLRWITKEENIERSFDLKHQTKNKKPVQQFSLEGKLIATYESMNEAFRRTNIRHISEAANGTRQTAGGYKWEYIIEGSDDLSD